MSKSVQIPFKSSTLAEVTSLLTSISENENIEIERVDTVEKLVELKDAIECAYYLQAKKATNYYMKSISQSIFYVLGISPSDELRDTVGRIVMAMSHSMRISVLHTIPLISLLILSTSPVLDTIPWRNILLSLFTLTERDIKSIDDDCTVESKDGIIRVPLCSPPQLIEKDYGELTREDYEENDSRELYIDKRIMRVKMPKMPPSSPLNISYRNTSESSKDYSHLLTPQTSPPPSVVKNSLGNNSSPSQPPNSTFYLYVMRYLIIEHLLSNVAPSGEESSEKSKNNTSNISINNRDNVEDDLQNQESMDGGLHNPSTEPHLRNIRSRRSSGLRKNNLQPQERTNTIRTQKQEEDILNNQNIPLDILCSLLAYVPYPYRSVRIRNAPNKEAMLLLQWMRYSGRFNFGIIRALDISKCAINSSDAIVLSNIIRDSPSLIKLCVGNNRLGAEGLETLLKVFDSPTCNISALHLEHNAIGPKGASVIAKALVTCKGLTSISLGYNQIGPEVEPICNSLCDVRCTISTLDIANNYIGDNGAFCLANALKSPQCTKTLKCIRVWDPSMTSAGGDMLVNSIENNEVLTEIGIGDSALTREARTKLNRLLRRNRGVTESNDPLAQRRRHEVDLLYGADSVFSDTWFLIDERWLAEWRDFARENSDAPPPGKISNWRLVKSDGTPIPGREKLRDYRGVCPKVYALFYSIYGGGPAIIRNKIDLYSEPVYYDLDTLLGTTGHV